MKRLCAFQIYQGEPLHSYPLLSALDPTARKPPRFARWRKSAKRHSADLGTRYDVKRQSLPSNRMDLLKKELERKKRELSKAVQGNGKKRKYFKASARYEVNQEETESKERESEKEQVNPTIEEPIPAKPKVESNEIKVDNERVLSELRQWRLPIRLFGETDEDRRTRWQEATVKHKQNMSQLSEQDDFRLGKGHSIRNPFLENAKEETPPEDTTKDKDEEVIENEQDYLRLFKDDPHKLIYRYFKDLLKEWEQQLESRPEDVRKSVAGRKDAMTHKQCKDYIKPMFKLCRKRTLDEGITAHLVKIVTCCIEGEFVKANDAYMDVAIGRAAWPIGVTMVGIHARTGRSKIESSNVAHVVCTKIAVPASSYPFLDEFGTTTQILDISQETYDTSTRQTTRYRSL